MKNFRIRPAIKVEGTVHLPGDKSISHRAAILASLAQGQTTIHNFLFSQDCVHTLRCLEMLGIRHERKEDTLVIHGKGFSGYHAPSSDLYMGNSGTSLRLLMGLLAGQSFKSRLTGDPSVSNRPMRRVMDPLRQMGALITAERGDEYPPIDIRGSMLKPIRYTLPVPSAQVKSAILLAGLFADGETEIIQEIPSRDHTERMFAYLGLPIQIDGLHIRVAKGFPFQGKNIEVPRDLSSAAFFIGLGLIHPSAEIFIPGVGVNPTRSGMIEILQKMGAQLEKREEREVSGEPVADIVIRSSRLSGTKINAEQIPATIDEAPIFAVIAALAMGDTEVRGALELRVKESDRIATIVDMLHSFGVGVEEYVDGVLIHGTKVLRGAEIDTHKDHRIAMASTIAGLVAKGETVIRDVECVNTSFPGFVGAIQTVCGKEVIEVFEE